MLRRPYVAGSVSTDVDSVNHATMTDETLATVLLLSHERGHTGQSRVTESTCTAGHHTVPGKEIRKSQKEEGGRRKEEGRRRKEEGGRRKEEGERRKEKEKEMSQVRKSKVNLGKSEKLKVKKEKAKKQKKQKK